MFQHRCQPCPGGFEFVAAVEQVQTAVYHFAQQEFVGFGAAACRGLRQIQHHFGGYGTVAADSLDGQPHAHGFLRLQADDDAVRHGGIEFAVVGLRFEIQHDFGRPARQPFAGTQVKRHARPARIVDFGFDGDIGFGAAASGDFVFLRVAVQAGRRGVLAAYGLLVDVFQRFERLDDFEFFVANVVGRQ